MGEVLLKVPAEYAEDFRSATVAEIAMDAEWVKEAAETLERWRLEGRVGDDESLGDVRGSTRCLGEAAELAEQAFAAGDGPVEVRGTHEALAHAFETMARKVIAPKLGHETNYSPYDEDIRKRLDELTRELGWASGESARMHALYSAERKARKAATA